MKRRGFESLLWHIIQNRNIHEKQIIMIDIEYDRMFSNRTGMLVMNEPFTWKTSTGETYTVSETGPIDSYGIMKITGCSYTFR